MKRSSSTSSHEKLDRKIVERNRRILMKGLCLKLTSLIPPHHFKSSKAKLSQPKQLNEAPTYIKQLKKRVEELKARRDVLAMSNDGDSNNSMRLKLPMVELREYLGSSLQVVLITGLKTNFMISEVIGVMEDEGAEVVTASFSTVGDKVFHTFHAQVKVSRLGVDISKVRERLLELVC